MSGNQTRADRVRGLKVIFQQRAEQDLLAALAIAEIGHIHWQDALDLYAEALEEAMASVTGDLTEKQRAADAS